MFVYLVFILNEKVETYSESCLRLDLCCSQSGKQVKLITLQVTSPNEAGDTGFGSVAAITGF